MKSDRVFPLTLVIIGVLVIALPLLVWLVQIQQFLLIGLIAGILCIGGGVAGIIFTRKKSEKNISVVTDIVPDSAETATHVSEIKDEPVIQNERLTAPPPAPSVEVKPKVLWYYTHAGKKRGPVKFTDLKRFVTTSDLVWTEGMADWEPANTIEGLCETANEKPRKKVNVPPIPPTNTALRTLTGNTTVTQPPLHTTASMITSDSAKRYALRKYFAPPPRSRDATFLVYFGIASVAFSMLGFLAKDFAAVCVGIGLLGLLMMVFGGIWLRSINQAKQGIPSDSDVDRWFQEDITQIVEKSLTKTGLNKSELVKEPLPITGPILWMTNGIPKTDLCWKKGKDGLVRFAVNRFTVILLSNQLLAVYTCDFNFLRNVALNESTQEYYYKDVVSVSTQEDSTAYTLPNGVSFVNSQAFKISVANGESFKIVISAGKLSEITSGTISTTSAEKAVQVIRAMLREKKQS